MPTLQSLLSDRATVRVPLDGKPLEQCSPDEAVTLVYRPSAVNVENTLKLRQLREQGAPAVERLAVGLHDMLVEWDVVQPTPTGALEPVPLTVEVLGSLGYVRLSRWHDAITEDLFPNPTTGTTSPLGSAGAAS